MLCSRTGYENFVDETYEMRLYDLVILCFGYFFLRKNIDSVGG